MNLYEAFERNLIDEPKAFPLGDTEEITMLPAGGEKARRAFEKMMEPYAARLNAGGKLTDEENKKLNVRFYAEYIVKNWKGFTDRVGKDIPFSVDNAKKLFSDKKLEAFFALVIRISQDDSAFQAAADESDAGN